MKKYKWLIIIGAPIVTLVAIAVLVFVMMITAQNKAINLEEQVNESVSAIEVQEKRRVDLIVNLVDTVQAYDKHEKETLQLLTEARSNAQNGNVEEAQMTIQAVTEAYPELKSVENYKTLMNELSVTENLIAEQRNNFNRQVKAYNKFVRKFPNGTLLSIVGYEEMDFEYLEYEAPSDAPTNLFGE